MKIKKTKHINASKKSRVATKITANTINSMVGKDFCEINTMLSKQGFIQTEYGETSNGNGYAIYEKSNRRYDVEYEWVPDGRPNGYTAGKVVSIFDDSYDPNGVLGSTKKSVKCSLQDGNYDKSFTMRGVTYYIEMLSDGGNYVAKWWDTSDNGLGYNNKGWVAIAGKNYRIINKIGEVSKENVEELLSVVSEYDRKPRKPVQDRLKREVAKLLNYDFINSSTSLKKKFTVRASVNYSDWKESDFSIWIDGQKQTMSKYTTDRYGEHPMIVMPKYNKSTDTLSYVLYVDIDGNMEVIEDQFTSSGEAMEYGEQYYTDMLSDAVWDLQHGDVNASNKINAADAYWADDINAENNRRILDTLQQNIYNDFNNKTIGDVTIYVGDVRTTRTAGAYKFEITLTNTDYDKDSSIEVISDANSKGKFLCRVKDSNVKIVDTFEIRMSGSKKLLSDKITEIATNDSADFEITANIDATDWNNKYEPDEFSTDPEGLGYDLNKAIALVSEILDEYQRRTPTVLDKSVVDECMAYAYDSYREPEELASLVYSILDEAYPELADVDACNDITAAVYTDPGSNPEPVESNIEYYQALADGVLGAIEENFKDHEMFKIPPYETIDAIVTTEAITFVDTTTNDVIWVQAAEDIVPNWDDLDSDIQDLFDAIYPRITPNF